MLQFNRAAHCLGGGLLRPELAGLVPGDNYARLRAIEDEYDPDGLFSPSLRRQRDWSADGFTRFK
jgi:hypothetical protein